MTFSLYENIKHIITQTLSIFKLAEPETSAIGRPKKIKDSDALTFAVYQHTSTRATKKSVYEDFKEILACSYKTFVVSVNRVASLTLRLLALHLRFNKQTQHLVKYTDATDIPVCLKKNMEDHQTMAGLAGLGRSTKGWFYGLKMSITRDHDGRLLAIRFTDPGANDRQIFRDINKEIYGIIVADAGYVSSQLEKDMNIEKKRWILLRPYKTMKKLMTKWQETLYKGRFKIEFDFRDLKLFHGLVTSLPRSVSGYLANYLHALLSFVIA